MGNYVVSKGKIFTRSVSMPSMESYLRINHMFGIFFNRLRMTFYGG